MAFDDVVGLLLYSSAISISIAARSSFDPDAVLQPLFFNFLVFVAGIAFGYGLDFLIPKKRSTDNILIIFLAVIFLFCALAEIAEVSPLLGCMSMGITYKNLTGDKRLFEQINAFFPPILLLFFVRSGANFRIGFITKENLAIGDVSLVAVSVIYFFTRIVGKYFGTYLGSTIAGKGKTIRKYLGLGLVPQAGVAIGLSSMGRRLIGGEKGLILEAIILLSSVLYELVGPGLAKLSLYLSKSYDIEPKKKNKEGSTS